MRRCHPSSAWRLPATAARPSPDRGRAPLTLACTPRTPATGIAYLVQRPPLRVFHRHGVFPTAGYPPRRSAGAALSCTWPASGASDRRAPFRARRPGNGAPGISSPSTQTGMGDPDHPGLPRPGTFRPQGFSTLPAVCSPPCPAAARRPPQRPWGSPFRALLLPMRGTPLGASPLLSFPRAAFAARPRLQRMTRIGKGNVPAARRQRPQTLPSWAFAPPGLSPPPPWKRLPAPGPSCHSTGTAPYGCSPGRGLGVFMRRNRLVSLETAGPPGVCHLSDSARLFGPRPSRAYDFASAVGELSPLAS